MQAMGQPKWDNYAAAAEKARELFLGYDQEKIITKLGLSADGDYLYLRFLDLDYRIHRRTGLVEKREGEGPYVDGGSFDEVMTLFDVLCWSREDASLSGEWVTLSALGGGVRMEKGEPGYVIPVFDFLPVYVQYWRGDEEFPPQLNLLWDANTTEFLHYETVYYLTQFLLRRLAVLLERENGAQQ